MRRAWNVLVILLIALNLFAVAACSRAPEDLEIWRPSKAGNGLEKLSLWIASPDEPLPVRVRACEILFEENYAYAVGSALDKASPEDRKAVVDGAAPRALEWYNTQDATVENAEAGRSQQILGKEAVYHLFRFAEGSQHKEALETALLDWLSKDYFIRDQMGAAKLNQIAEAVGPKAADPLLDALAVKENNQAFIAEMLRKINDPAIARRRAETIGKMAEGQLPKLDQDVEVALLEETDKAIIPTLVKIVDDESADGTLRTNAHAMIGKLDERGALPVYINWVKKGPNLLRWISVQGIGELHGKPGVTAILKALPETADYAADDKTEGFSTDAGRFCMVEVVEMKTPLEDVFVAALKDGTTPARAVALRCLQEKSVGTAAARPAVEALLKDKTELPAWKDTRTLGELAQATLDVLPK